MADIKINTDDVKTQIEKHIKSLTNEQLEEMVTIEVEFDPEYVEKLVNVFDEKTKTMIKQNRTFTIYHKSTKFEVKRWVAYQCGTFVSFATSSGLPEEPTYLYDNTDSPIEWHEKLFEFCKYRYENRDKTQTELDKLDHEFLNKMEEHIMYKVVFAANKLQCEAYINAIALETINYKLKNKTKEELRDMFGEPADGGFAPGEEKKIREENGWLNDPSIKDLKIKDEN